MAQANAGNLEELTDGHAHIFNQLFSLVRSMSLKCAVQLGIPDLIHAHARPMTLHQLIAGLSIDTAKSNYVYSLMRILTHSGYFVTVKVYLEDNEEEEGYWPTPLSRLLLTHDPLSAAPFVLSFLDPILMEPWESLSKWLQNDRVLTPFDMVHGRTRWDSSKHSGFDQVFNEAMAIDARFVAGVLIGEDLKGLFDGLESIVDVGGGTGEMAKAIAGTFPEMRCTVLDLPQVVGSLEGSRNLNYVAGNMFEFIPPANAVLMKWILHCWSDEESVDILKKCREAIPRKDKGGKVMIIEMVVGKCSLDGDRRAYETQLLFDMEDMVLVPGRERTEEQWARLFVNAGFTSYKVFPILGLRCLIEVYP